MKKKYLKPEMNVYEMEPQQLLAASDSETFSLRDRTEDGNDEMW